MGQQEFHNGEVSPGTGQGEGIVVVVGGLLVDIGTLRDEELHRAQVASPRSLHQWGATSLRLVFLEKKKEKELSVTGESLKIRRFIK